jgi:hypothetical protein
MDLQESHFRYNAVIKNEQDISFEGLSLFPGLSEISFQSRIFPNYAECVKSCKGLMEDMTRDINSNLQDKKFKVGAEVNPVHSGNPTMSKDWGSAEVARFWVYDKAMEGTGAIAAVCRGSIFAIPKDDQRIIN